MRIVSIIRARIIEDAQDEFFCAYDKEDAIGILNTLYTGGWFEAEVSMVTKRDKKLEGKIFDCEIGSDDEQRLLRKYYNKQA